MVVSDDTIPGMAMSEADVIREVFRKSAMDRSSCRVIASRLNELRVPCAYVRDERLQLRGKRKQATSGYWTPGRIRGLITNTTYKGKHEYGKRTKSTRPVLPRTVPSIVAEDQWEQSSIYPESEHALRQMQCQVRLSASRSHQMYSLWSHLHWPCGQPANKNSITSAMERTHLRFTLMLTGVVNQKASGEKSSNGRYGRMLNHSFETQSRS